MVKILHREGIEVILDVVYNHSSEGNHMGPMLSFKGIDNPTYYRLVEDDQRFYMDYTGTGNHAQRPGIHKCSSSLWIACGIGRSKCTSTAFGSISHRRSRAASKTSISSRPFSISSIKTRSFRASNSSRNRGTSAMGATKSEIFRCCGPNGTENIATPFESGGRATKGRSPNSRIASRARAISIKPTVADLPPVSTLSTRTTAFSLNDLVSYNEKHNEANGEGNNDGATDNESWNLGVEGPTDDPDITELRERQKRNFLATLFFLTGRTDALRRRRTRTHADRK